MKILCESCSAQYDLDESRIPPSGMMMKCPACLHQFKVTRTAASSPALAKPREIDLSPLHEVEQTPLPEDAPGMVAPKRSAPPPPGVPVAAHEEAELPAPKAAKASRPPVPPIPTLGKASKPPAIEVEPTRDDGGLSVGAPVALSDDGIDLPAPVSTRAPAPPPPIALEVADLPAPRPGPPSAELPAPKRAAGPPASLPSIGLDLDAPDPEDLGVALPPRPLRPSSPRFAGPPPVDDGPPGIALDVVPATDAVDVLAPKPIALDVVPATDAVDVLAPKAPPATQAPPHLDVDLPAPKQEATDVAPKGPSPDAATPAQDFATAAERVARPAKEAEPAKPVARPFEPEEEDAPAPKRRLRTALIAVGGVVTIIGAVGVGLGMFTSSGYFGAKLFSGRRAESEATMNAARKLLADDTLASYRKAALALKAITEAEPTLVEPAALEAQAHLAMARLGTQSAVKAAGALLQRFQGDPGGEPPPPDLLKARALELLVAGKPGEAKAKLQAVLQAAPSDASALVYLGWVELSLGDAAAAEQAFGKALKAEPSRAAALYGAGVARERLGDVAPAHDLYTRVLARSPEHFGAQVGVARTSVGRDGVTVQAAQAKIDEIVAKRSGTAAPRELSDAWTSLAQLAAKAGRRDEAEDRLRRALTLDPTSSRARVLLSRVQCDAKKCGESLDALKQVVAAEPRNVPARLQLVRALLETGAREEAGPQLAEAAQLAPTHPQVLYFLGRAQLGGEQPDPAKALTYFKEAVAADPKYIDAYLAESQTLAQLGKHAEALEALKQAEDKASDDPELMTELGQAYLALGRAAEAEARFRAALLKKPGLHDARVALGVALEAQGKPEDAAKEYDEVDRADPEYPGLAERRARLAASQGRNEVAWELYQKALGQGVPTHTLRLLAADLALKLDKPDEALALAQVVARDDERSPLARLTVARAHLAKQRWEDALAEGRRSATLADLPESHLVVAQALEKLNKLDQAMTEYNLARRPPVEAVASLGRARIMVRMGATRDALTELAVLVKDPKLRAPALLLLGDSYADQGQADKARHAYEDAVKAAPQSGEALFKLGRANYDAGRRKPAVELLARALKAEGETAPWAADAWLIVGDAQRELKVAGEALKAYKKYLELAPPDAKGRAEVLKHVSNLGDR